MLALAAVSFWIVRAQGLVYGYFNFLNIARYPDVIFPRVFRWVFGWIVPVIIVANIPARLLIKSIGQPAWLMFHLIVAGTIAALISRVLLAMGAPPLFERQFVNRTLRLRGESHFEIAPKPLARKTNCP